MKFPFAVSALLFTVSTSLYALPAVEQIQVSTCLAAELPKNWTVLAEDKSFKIVEIPTDGFTQLHQIADKANCGFFVNVTHSLPQKNLQGKKTTALALLQKPKTLAIPVDAGKYEIKHQEIVQAALKEIEPENIWKTLTRLTSWYNRSATQQNGVDAVNWIQSQFDTMVQESGRLNVRSWMVKTGTYYKQPSLVTMIGTHLADKPGIVLGAHTDTLDGRMPGAGDDGSGSATIMEIARILLNSDQEFKRPIYIIWYAAEERGLVGSQYVVKEFMANKVPVKAAIQFDMTGWRTDAQDPTMWVYRDYTDTNLSNFTASLIKEYVQVPVKYSRCGYGCSDHASWNEVGIPAAFPCESSFEEHNPYIHSAKDTMDLLTLEHMTNFTKLGLAFAIELASE